MKSLQTLFIATLLALASTSLYAKSYYVCNNGNDAGFGETKAKPFKTFDKAISKFGSMRAGDSISFCRGGQFSVLNYGPLFNTKSLQSNPIVIDDYYAPGSMGDELRPVINSETGVFYFNTRNVSSPDGGVTIKNLILAGVGKGQGIFTLNGFSHLEVDNVLLDGFRVGIYIAGGATESNGITLKNSVIQNNTEQGWLGGGSNVIIENNHFQNNGFSTERRSAFFHNIYVSDPAEIPSNNLLISGNTLYQSAMGNGKCGGASLIVHGQVNNIVIENNLIKEDKGTVTQFCYGIGVGPAYGTAEEFNNVVIRNNKLINMGSIGISGGSLVNAVISNNIIVDESEVLAKGIAVPDWEGNAEDTKSKNVTISDNIISFNYEWGTGVYIGGTHPYIVKNNTVSRHITSKGKCITKKDANLNTDTSSNVCKTHTKVFDINTLLSSVSIDDTSEIEKAAEQALREELKKAAEKSLSDEAEMLARHKAEKEMATIKEAQAEETRLKAAVQAAAQAAAEAAAAAAAAKAAAIQAVAIAQVAEEQEREEAEAIAQAQVQIAAQVAAQAQSAATAQERAQIIAAAHQTTIPSASNSEQSNPKVDYVKDKRQNISLGSSGSGGSGGWSTSSGLVTYSDVVYAISRGDKGASSGDNCRATSADGECLLK